MWYPMSDRGSVAPVVWLVLWLETPRISCAWSPFFDTVSQIWIISVPYARLLSLVVECTKVIECQDRIILSRYHWELVFQEVVLHEILGQGRSDSEKRSSPRDSDNEHDSSKFHISLTLWPYHIYGIQITKGWETKVTWYLLADRSIGLGTLHRLGVMA